MSYLNINYQIIDFVTTQKQQIKRDLTKQPLYSSFDGLKQMIIDWKEKRAKIKLEHEKALEKRNECINEIMNTNLTIHSVVNCYSDTNDQKDGKYSIYPNAIQESVNALQQRIQEIQPFISQVLTRL